jgi:holin-like protein
MWRATLTDTQYPQGYPITKSRWRPANEDINLAHMIATLAIILGFQLAGEVASQALSLPLPGPVVGLLLLVATCILRPAVADRIRPTTLGLLQHLSLFFVPAGVGIVAHWGLLKTYGIGLAVAVAGSTILAIAAGAVVFERMARWTGSLDPAAIKEDRHE